MKDYKNFFDGCYDGLKSMRELKNYYEGLELEIDRFLNIEIEKEKTAKKNKEIEKEKTAKKNIDFLMKEAGIVLDKLRLDVI